MPGMAGQVEAVLLLFTTPAPAGYAQWRRDESKRPLSHGKTDMKSSFLTSAFGCILLISKGLALASGPVPVAVSASSPDGPDDRFAARYTIDGDFSTRWSSDHSEPHWIAFDFGEPVALHAVRLHWETAFGRDYDIELSDDGESWETAYRWRDGSGGIDHVYFGPREARHLRIYGIRRATGWGFSLFQVEFPGPEERRTFDASTVGDGDPPESIMDGDLETAWRVTRQPGEPHPWIQVNLPAREGYGGLALHWEATPGPPWVLHVREEADAEWSERTRSPGSNEAFEEVYLERSDAQALRLELLLEEGESAALAELAIKGPDETWNPSRHFEVLARRTPDGLYPWWLKREQGYFTVVGRPGSAHVTLIDEDGRIEPRKDAFSVVPFLIEDGSIRTVHAFETDQSLARNWMPIPRVRWEGDALRLEVEAVDADETRTDVLYTLANTGTETWEGALALALHPLQVNPPWQRGGFSAIHEALWNPQSGILKVNHEPAVHLTPVPAHGGVIGRLDEDVAEVLARGEGWLHREADPDGVVSAGWRYDLVLEPGTEFQVLVQYPLDGSLPPRLAHPPAEHFANERAQSEARWMERVGQWELNAPDERFERFVRSNLAYLLINAEGYAIQPGSRNYQHSWIRDGSISATAMLFFGMEDTVRNYVRWFTDLVHDDGFVPFIVNAQTGIPPDWTADWKEYDSFGQFAYMVREFYEVTRDRELVEHAWPKVRAAMNKAARLRQDRLGPEWEGTEFEGILPESNSHEGYFPAAHSYWDVFFALRGHEDAAELAAILGLSEEEEHFRGEEAALREAMLVTMERVREMYGLDTLPASADLGDFDPTSTSIGIMLGDERDNLPHDALQATYDRYMREARLRALGGEHASSYTAYEGRNVGALLRLDRQDDARWLLDWLLEDATRPPGWNHMGEVTHPDPRQAGYIGDMPHTWVGSGMIHAIRDLFLYEERARLILAQGLTEEEMSAGVSIANWSTRWGIASYELGPDDRGDLVLRLELERMPPNGFSVPEGVRLFVNDEEYTGN